MAARSIAYATARRTATSSNGGIATLNDANEKNTVPVVVWISGRSEGFVLVSLQDRRRRDVVEHEVQVAVLHRPEELFRVAADQLDPVREGQAERVVRGPPRRVAHERDRSELQRGKPVLLGPIRHGVNPLAGARSPAGSEGSTSSAPSNMYGPDATITPP